MKSLNLDTKWEKISEAKTQSGYKSLRISSDCILDLFIGTDEDGYRCLFLFLPHKIEVRLKGTNKEKLKIEFIKSKNVILIKLMDNDFIDLFNDLIVSLFAKVEDISEPKVYANELIVQFYKWAEFFVDRFDSKLSVEEIMGLWGELFILKELLEEANPTNINILLDTWKGPYDKTNDFEFDDKNIEVKTKEKVKNFVKISSEFQLEKEFEKGLELIVVTVTNDLITGFSLNDLINRIVLLSREKLGDLSIFYKALKQKNLTVDNSKEYNNYRFKALNKIAFNCANEEFPKLSKSNIPVEITRLKYKLRTTALNDFIIEEKNY